MGDVFVAFRHVRPDHDPWLARATVWLSQDDNDDPEHNAYCHVEVGVVVGCLRPFAACRYCAPDQASPGRHRLAFSISSQRDHVYYHCDREYAPAHWRLVHAPVSAVQLNLVQSFLQAQLGKPFNRWGLWGNFWTWRCWPRVGCTAVGPDASASPAWFCSELAAAALACLDVCPDSAPCAVSPNALYRGLQAHPVFDAAPADSERAPLMSPV